MPPSQHYDFYAHPASVDEVVCLVKKALAECKKIRVRGAHHSEPGSVLADPADSPNAAIHVMLDKLGGYSLSGNIVTAGGGISLGGDPAALGGVLRNAQFLQGKSLFHRLFADGMAVPVTGGISHQTLAGFIANGAAGGSLQYSFLDAVLELTFVDGLGNVQTVRRDDAASCGPERFQAALVSLGLFGILVEAKLRVEPTFDILGLRSVQCVERADFKLFSRQLGPGKHSIADFLRLKPYSRALWWPQPGVERIEFWEAKRFDAQQDGPIVQGKNVPSQEVGLPGPALQILARLVLELLGGIKELPGMPPGGPRTLQDLLRADPRAVLQLLGEILQHVDGQKPSAYEIFAVIADLTRLLQHNGAADQQWYPTGGATPSDCALGLFPDLTDVQRLAAMATKLFVELSPEAWSAWPDWDGFARKYMAQLFKDPWHLGLPMDNPINEHFLPVTFTELWVPFDRAHEALDAIENLFRTTPEAIGTFAIELYAAKLSDAWMSASHQRDVFRIDPFYLEDGNPVARSAFFQRFWDVLYPFDMRFHWAKALSAPNDVHCGIPFRRASLPHFDDFLQHRAQWDPKQIFVNDYWRAHLGIAP